MTHLNENMGQLVQAVGSSRSHHPVLVLPRLILSMRDPQPVSLPVSILHHVVHGTSWTSRLVRANTERLVPVVPSSLHDVRLCNHRNLWRPVSTATSAIIPRLQAQANRHISNVARQVTEESESQ